MEKIKILYAEDDELTRLNYKEFLLELGFEVKDVANGDEVYHSLHEKKWDLLLLDMKMPGKTGREIIHELRKKGEQIPIIVLSSLDYCNLLLEGADDFVDKSESREHLHVRIVNVLNRRKQNKPHVIFIRPEMQYDKINRIVSIGEKEYKLRPTIGKIFLYFCLRQNEYVTEEELCMHVWSIYNRCKISELHSYISSIREILQQGNGVLLQKEYGGDYCFIVK